MHLTYDSVSAVYWVAVKEFKLNDYRPETLLFTTQRVHILPI